MLLCLIAIKMYQVVGMIRDVFAVISNHNFKSYKQELSLALVEEFNQLRIREALVNTVKISVETTKKTATSSLATLSSIYKNVAVSSRVTGVVRSE